MSDFFYYHLVLNLSQFDLDLLQFNTQFITIYARLDTIWYVIYYDLSLVIVIYALF